MSGMAYAQHELKQCIERAVAHANACQRSIVAAYSWNIEAQDVSVLASGTEERFYFTTPDRSMRAIGFGIAQQLNTAGPDRFLRMQSQWSNLNRDHIGTDLFAFCGFSFAELKHTEYRWSSFGEASMTVPKYLYLEQDGHTTVTVFALIEPQSNAEKILNQLAVEYAALHTPKSGQFVTRIRLTRDGNDAFEASFHQAAQLLKTSLKKIVLAREVVYELDQPVDLAGLVQELESSQPGSYIFFFQPTADEAFIGATPERLVLKTGLELKTAAVAGSAPRHMLEQTDIDLGQSLLQDDKNRMEHAIVVDSIENTLQNLSTRIEKPHEPMLLKNRHIQHLYTPINATLLPEVSLFQLIEKLHPTPALGGEPKEAAVAAIQSIETFERGWYGSPVGWMDGQENGEFIVAIRSGLFTDRTAVLYAGCGIVEGSRLQSELEETDTKLSPMLRALSHLCTVEKDDIYVD